MSPHLVVLLQSCNHDDDAAPLLPHHVPEVSHSVQHRPLGGDVGPLGSSVTLQDGESSSPSTHNFNFWTKEMENNRIHL